VDVQEFPVIDAPVPEYRPYTFLAFGDRGTRKGMDTAWQAFYKAFEDNPDVRFVVKSRPSSLREFCTAFGDKRVSLWREDVQSLARVFSQVDCFVFPTKGEGWGLPPREAACMGKPVICTAWSGTADCEHWAMPIKKYTMRPANIKGKGEWAVPDVDETAEHMRWCFEHREDARQRGLKAAQWLRENQTWDHSAKALKALIEEWG
jgi:glycosyltransferase involved in cell wall biosynthesis